jgi:hypothetical protein
MNWYKIATPLVEDFESRNRLNSQIESLKETSIILDHLSKMVFQSGSIAREKLAEVANDKKLSSFPFIEQTLSEAIKACLDSPHRSSSLIKSAVSDIVLKIDDLEHQRHEFVEGLNGNNDRYWGWVEED